MKNKLNVSDYDLVYEVGIDALDKRKRKAKEQSRDLKNFLAQIQEAFQAVEKHSRNTSLKYTMLNKKQKELHQKLLEIMHKVELMRCHGTAVMDDEYM